MLDLVFIVTQFLVKKEGPRLYYRKRKIGDAKEKSAERESTVPFSLVASPLSTPAMRASTIEIYNNHGILGASVAPVRLY